MALPLRSNARPRHYPRKGRAYPLVFLLATIFPFFAAHSQANLLGLEMEQDRLQAMRISVRDRSIASSNVGTIKTQSTSGYVVGRFIKGEKPVLLNVRRVNSKTFRFSATREDGTRESHLVTLSHPLGERFQILSGFDHARDGIADLAIIDRSRPRLRWAIIENPLHTSGRQMGIYVHGKRNDLIEWYATSRRQIQFAAIRYSEISKTVRATILSFPSGRTRPVTARHTSPVGKLTPLRMNGVSNARIGIALRQADTGDVLTIGNDGRLLHFQAPASLCGGLQVVTLVNPKGTVRGLEFCADRSYRYVERRNQLPNPQDELLQEGAFSTQLNYVRRGDFTEVSGGVEGAPASSPGEAVPIGDPSPGEPPADPTPALTVTPTPAGTPTNTPTPTPTPDPIEIVSTSTGGIQANGDSTLPRSSGDGRYVAFTSYASNLVAGDGNAQYDAFVKDVSTGVIIRVSTDSAGNEANSESWSGDISADGRYVIFGSGASNLVAGDTNGTYDLFLKDLSTGATTRISTDSAGGQANDYSIIGDQRSLSEDGEYAVFQSLATNLVSGDTNGHSDIFVKHIGTGITTRVSTNSLGGEANAASSGPSISANGRYVVFLSGASNLVSGDTNGVEDIFVKDLQTGAISRVSTNSAGIEQNAGAAGLLSISGDGRYIAFHSYATNLTTGSFSGEGDIFMKDTTTGITTRISTNSAGQGANYGSWTVAISNDGRYVAFESWATNLVAEDTLNAEQIFLKDTLTGATILQSSDMFGGAGNRRSKQPSFSANGRYLTFASRAWTLASGDSNDAEDVFRMGIRTAPIQ